MVLPVENALEHLHECANVVFARGVEHENAFSAFELIELESDGSRQAARSAHRRASGRFAHTARGTQCVAIHDLS